MDGVADNRGDAGFRVDELGDEALLAGTRRLVGQSNQTLALLLAHLAEVEARGIHRTRACATLYTYCVYELRLSEDAAFRRAKAARFCRQFPRLYDAVAAGELHLTGLLMLGPHLTEDNHVEVLARAKHRTKREIARLVRQLDPLPAVPARVEPLGPEPAIATPRAPTWSEFAASFSPVRELGPGARPRYWVDDAERGAGLRHGATGDAAASVDDGLEVRGADCDEAGRTHAGDARAAEAGGAGAGDSAAQNGGGAPGALEAPQRYKVQFTASQEYVDLLERARDLLAHALPERSIEEVHLRALRALVAMLEKKKYGATDRARSAAPCTGDDDEDLREQPRRRGAPSRLRNTAALSVSARRSAARRRCRLRARRIRRGGRRRLGRTRRGRA